MVMVGADTEKLYPSLDHQTTADALLQATLLTPIEWEDMLWDEMAKYVVVCLDSEDPRRLGLERILPVRRSNHGTKPTINGEEMISGVLRNKESMWVKKEIIPTRSELRLLMATCIYI